MFPRSHAQASPSVTVENGLARLRPIRPRSLPKLSYERGRPGSVSLKDSEHKAAGILASMACVVLLIVCLALYLLSRSPRWELLSLPFQTRIKLLSSSSALHDPLLTPLPVPHKSMAALPSRPWDPSEQYLSYLPHSGFHNQRIALENALVLASILNCTLLVPPVQLGDRPIGYRRSSRLRVNVALSTHIGLEHCALVSDSRFVPEVCIDLWTHAHVPWDWFVNLSRATRQHGIRTLVRWDLTDMFLARLRIFTVDTYFINDTDPYQFRFFDSRVDTKPLGSRYQERIDIPTLAALSHGYRLLQFGTLFGTTRIRLVEPAHILLRTDVRRAMVFANADLLTIADGVRDSTELGGMWGYAGVHLRLGDGVFASGEVRARNVRHVWWKLVRALGVNDEVALDVEKRSTKGKSRERTLLPPNITALRAPHPPPPAIPPNLPHACGRIAPHPLFDIPLYIATDKPGHHALSLFTRSFPCVYFLSNFSSHLAHLREMYAPPSDDTRSQAFQPNLSQNLPRSDIRLAPFLPPFLDAIIASKARVVAGTPGSTFSSFMEDVLWRAYHHWDIVQRG